MCIINCLVFIGLSMAAAGELSHTFYESSCPDVLTIVETGVTSAIVKDARMGASLLQMHFHDCFVNGCDGSLLLEDTATFKGEQTAPANDNSLRGFSSKGLSVKDMVALSGAHTIGQAKCSNFRGRLYTEGNIDRTLSVWLKSNCPKSGGDGNLSPLDPRTPHAFDNSYFINLESGKTLLHSDQVLYSHFTRSRVKEYSSNLTAFFHDFAAAMVKMGALSPLTGSRGQIRRDCRRIN